MNHSTKARLFGQLLQIWLIDNQMKQSIMNIGHAKVHLGDPACTGCCYITGVVQGPGFTAIISADSAIWRNLRKLSSNYIYRFLRQILRFRGKSGSLVWSEWKLEEGFTFTASISFRSHKGECVNGPSSFIHTTKMLMGVLILMLACLHAVTTWPGMRNGLAYL